MNYSINHFMWLSCRKQIIIKQTNSLINSNYLNLNSKVQCVVDKKSYKVGETLPKIEGPVSVSDWVFIVLPCEKSKYSLDKLSEIQKQFQAKFRN